MNFLFTSLFTLFVFASAIAIPLDDIKVGTNAKNSSLEIRFTSTTNKKNIEATVSIINEKGNVVNSFKAIVNNGVNIIPLNNALSLKEGLYKVNILMKRKTLSTKLMIFE